MNMVVSSCQIIGYLGGVITLIATILATCLTDWKHTIYSEEIFDGTVVKKGLWATCSVRQSGSIECKPLSQPFFNLSPVMRGCRVITIISALFGFCGILVTPLGMHCTRIGGDKLTKVRLARCGAVLFALCGILIGAAASWFADDVANNSNNKIKTSNIFQPEQEYKYVYGNSVFIGWAAMVAGVLSSLCLGIGSFSPSGNEKSSGSTNSESRVLTLDESAMDNSTAVLESGSYGHQRHYGTNSTYHHVTKHSQMHNNNTIATKTIKSHGNPSQPGNYASTILAGRPYGHSRQGSFKNGRANTLATAKVSEHSRDQHKTYV